MIDSEKLKPILAGYKEYFPKHWEKSEKYKWIAIKHFQSNWNIEADDFGEMFKCATDKTDNLLSSGYSYPRGMIINFAKVDNEAVRKMFKGLYDESRDLAERVTQFQAKAEEIRVRYDDGTWRNHYQNTNAISTYLWLMFPDKYYIYKFELYRNAAKELSADYKPKRDGSAETMAAGFSMYDEICSFIKEDEEIRKMINTAIDDSCYNDPEMKTLTIDVCFYLSRFYLEEIKNAQEENEWYPNDYSPNLSVEDWIKLLNDESIFNDSALQIMNRLKDCGDMATCTQLSLKYGGKINFYNSGITALAKRIHKKTKCPLFIDNTGNTKYWPIVCIGKTADKNDEGCFTWKIRPELSEALDTVDLSDIPLYLDDKPSIWKISHGTEHTGISDENKLIFEENSIVVVHGSTHGKASSKISQGQAFTDGIRNGDYFYLCYGNEIQLLGQIISDKPELNHEMENGWFERKYKIISKPLKTEPYSGIDKWWTPNDNSTCIRVKRSEETQFEEYILMPYFGMTLAQLFSERDVTDTIQTVQKLPPYTKDDFLRAVYMTEERYNVLKALLLKKQNVILQGAPGVGKTFTAKRLAYAIMGKKDDSRIEMVQFHQNYSYEDFIMGYRPDGADFRLTDGIFYSFCNKAKDDPNEKYFFIIDEINRGNMSKIFGELLMLIENDYRGQEITLAYNGKRFSVPKNLYIIGMMNTADRSLAMIDYALRRRFSFFEIEPGFGSDGFIAYQQELHNETFDALISQIKSLNKEISEDKSLGNGFCIGHSYFCSLNHGECTSDWMRSIVEFDILPQLNEYWFDDPSKYRKWEANLRGVFDD